MGITNPTGHNKTPTLDFLPDQKMSFFTKLGSRNLLKQLRNYSSSSSIVKGDSKSIITSKEKSGAALSLLISETNSEKFINICRAAVLTPDYDLDGIAFPAAISKISKSDYFEDIDDFIKELKNRPDLRNEQFVAQSIVLYGQAGKIENGITTFERMEQMSIRRTVKSFNALLFSCYLAKRYDEVKRIFMEYPMKYKVEPDIDSYNTVIKALCMAGESSSGYSIVAAMVQKKCPKPNATTYANLIAGYNKAKKSEDVVKVLKLMEEHGMKPGHNLCNVRIGSLCELGRLSEAKALFDGMFEQNMKPGSNTYSSLVIGFCMEGKLEDAKLLFKRMGDHGYKPTHNCYIRLICLLCQSGDYEKALQLSKQSIEKKQVPNFTTMKSLVEGLVSISKVDEAKELVKLLRGKFPEKAHLWKQIKDRLSK